MVGGKPAALLFLLAVVLGLSGCVTKENYNAQVLRTNNFQRLLAEEEKRGVELSTEIAKLKDEKAGLEAKNKALAAQLTDAKAQVVRSLEEVGRLQDEVKQSRGGFSSVPALRGPSQEPPDRLGELQPPPAAPSEKKGDRKKEKASAQVKAPKMSLAPAPVPPPKAEPVVPAPPPALLPRESSQEPPDRLGELLPSPAVKSEKKVEKKAEKPVARKTGKATATVRVQKQSEEPPAPPKAEAPATPPPPPAKAEAKAKAEPKAPDKTEPEAASDDSFFLYHKVKKGETLASIAKLYKTDAQTLRELNDLANGASVRPGDRLIVGQKQ